MIGLRVVVRTTTIVAVRGIVLGAACTYGYSLMERGGIFVRFYERLFEIIFRKKKKMSDAGISNIRLHLRAIFT